MSSTKDKKVHEKLLRGFEEVKQLLLPNDIAYEYEAKAEIHGVPCRGFLDGWSPSTKTCIELKTGRELWEEDRACSHGQFAFYAALMEAEGTPIDIFHLISLSTSNGDMRVISLKFTDDDICRMQARIVDNWSQMEEAGLTNLRR